MATTGDDCYFFYYSTCSKGSSCPYRHCTEALGNEVTCINWKQGFCFRPNCAFRHMDIMKNRSEIVCYWESQPLGCQKLHCPFKHVKRSTTGGASTPASSMSLINRLPTITGPVTKPLPAVIRQPTPLPQMVTPNVQPAAHPLQDLKDSVNVPTVKPVVVTPMDSEDDESISTMSTDGSPGKRLLVSPLRSSNKLPSRDRVSPLKQPLVHPASAARPDRKEDNPRSLGIKTLAEIRREKNAERGHDEVEEEEEEEEEEMDSLLDDDDDGDQLGVFPTLTRRIIAVSNNTTRKLAPEEKKPPAEPAGRRALMQSQTKEAAGVRSLAQIQVDRMKRLGSSLAQGGRETGNMTKRIKISKTEEPPAEVEAVEGVEKKIVRRVIVDSGGEPGRKREADSSGLGSIKIKSVAEIKKDRLAHRLGKRVAHGNNDEAKDDSSIVVTSSGDRRGRLANRLGNVVRAFDSDGEDGMVRADGRDSSAAKKGSLAGRLGTVTRTVVGGGRDDRSSSRDGSVARAGSLAGRLGIPVKAGGGDAEDKSSAGIKMVKGSAEMRKVGAGRRDAEDEPGVGIKIKSLAEIRRARADRGDAPDKRGAEINFKSSEEIRTAQSGTLELEDEPGAGIKIKSLAEIRRARADRGDAAGEQGAGIKIKSLEEIRREKLLKRLGKPARESDEEGKGSDAEKAGSSQEEQEEEEEEEEHEEKEEEQEEDKKTSGEIRIKTLAEIRRAKQSYAEVDREKAGGTAKKGAQSTVERRSKKRTEMALYKPPSALRGLKENQASGPGSRRSVLRVDKEEESKSDEDRPVKFRRLNLSRSVETANKGTDSVLTVIKQSRGEGSSEDSPPIKVKSLAEIRAEKQRLAQRQSGGDNIISAAPGGDQEEEKGASGSEEEGGGGSPGAPISEREPEAKVEPKTEEEKRRERRSKIWSRSFGDGKPENPPLAGGGGDADKNQDAIRRERRARLWNLTPPDQATPPCPTPEIKIKTLAEIRRDRQLLRDPQPQQQQQQRTGDQVPTVSSQDSAREDGARTGDAPVGAEERLSEEQTGNQNATRSSASSSAQESERRTDRVAVAASDTGEPRSASDVATETASATRGSFVEENAPVIAAAAQDIPSKSGTKLARKPVRGRPGRRVPNTSQETVPSSTNGTASDNKPIPSQSSFIPDSAPSLVSSATAPAEPTEGSRQDSPVTLVEEEELPRVGSVEVTGIPVAQSHTNPDSTTTEDTTISRSRPAAKRLVSVTEDEDLHRFLEENDDDDLDSKPSIAMATHDDDDLLNELDDFLNS